jgi:uncharacterized protein YqjF (DUF2071 family)
MSGRTRLRGTEALTLELAATLEAAATRELVPERFELDTADGAARASVLLFKMSGLAAMALPFPSFDYAEALWRVSIRHEGEPAWFAVKCDLDDPIVRALGARLVRYPTRAARIVGAEGRWRVEAEGSHLEVRVDDQDDAPIPETRRTFVADGARVYEIPWEEVAPSRARRARITVADDALLRATLGATAKLIPEAITLRGRVHMCGFARRL